MSEIDGIHKCYIFISNEQKYLKVLSLSCQILILNLIINYMVSFAFQLIIVYPW